MADPVNVGYFDMGLGEGNANQRDEIVDLGLTPVNVANLTAEILATLKVLVIQNPYGSFDELRAALPALDAAIANGLVVIYHDRVVNGAQTLFGALAGITFVENFAGGGQMQLGSNSGLFANGPFGTVTDTSVDGYNFSNHGYVLLSSLPEGALVFMTTNDPTHVTAFGVRSGAGMVIYTSAPVDYWGDDVAGSSNTDFFGYDLTGMETFARKLMAYAAGLLTPGAVDDAATVTESVATTIVVLGNDTSPNTALHITTVGGQTITVGATVTLATGSTVRLNADGTLTYTSGASYDALSIGQTGAETIAYSVANIAGDFTDTGSVSVTINGDYERIGPATPRADTLVGTLYDDYVDGLAGNDTITTGLGNDVIRGGLGVDRMTGGGGDDYYYVGEAGDQVIEALNGGNDTVESSLATYTLVTNVENLVLGEGARDGTGNTLNNNLMGNGAANTLNGASGDDSISGGAGRDVLIGGAGSDRLTGGSDADTFLFLSQTESGSSVGMVGRGTGVAPYSTDTVTDFSAREGDKIDLRALDANVNTKANDDFVVVDHFTRVAGQMVIEAISGVPAAPGGLAATGDVHYRITADTNGDGVADFTLELFSQGVLRVSDLSSILGIQSVNIDHIPGQPIVRDAAPVALDAGWII